MNTPFKLEELNCLPFVRYQVHTNSEGLVDRVSINQVNLPEMVEAIYPKLDPKNDLRKNGYAFNLLPEDQKRILATEMLIFRYCIFRILTHYQLYRSQENNPEKNPEKNSEDEKPGKGESTDQIADINSNSKNTKNTNNTNIDLPKTPANRSLKETHPKILPKWGYRLGEDYYGEELEGVYLYPEFSQQLDIHFEYLRRHNSTSQLEYILQLEHGRLLPSLKNKTWKIKQIPEHELYFSNSTYQEKCAQNLQNNPEYAEQLKKLPYPRGITIYQPDLNRYKVIDGYHRFVGKREGESPLVIYHD